MADVGVNRIPAIKRSRYAISRLFFFLLESAKHTIPDYERTCVVFINVLWVTPMMDTMMRWRIKDKLEPSRQLSDCFRVNPKLVKGIKGGDQCEVEGAKTEECDGQAECKGPDYLERTLPKRNTQIVLLTLMVNNVAAPKQVDFMAHSVRPIVGVIHQEHKQYPVPPRGVIQFHQREVLEQELINANPEDLEKQSRKL